MSVRALQIYRKVALCLACVFSIVVLGMAAHVMQVSLNSLGVRFHFAMLSIASASLTLLTLPVMMLIDLKRTGAFTSWVIFEIIWLSALCILWVTTGADATSLASTFFTGGCGFANVAIATACHEFPAIAAFSFLTWFTLASYTLILLAFAVIGHTRGSKVWFSSVKEGNFFHPRPTAVRQRQMKLFQFPGREKYRVQPYPLLATPPPTATVFPSSLEQSPQRKSGKEHIYINTHFASLSNQGPPPSYPEV